ncbi:hypothetical protein [Methylophilus aquaticus]|uniref:Outer membrane protein assembly factor BamE n=1 Tax=Methylophilus aquaticus TaxID=1971610 RepID=A0ABT9JQT9_9PROT|nr:hypothetical protein [Methylophilus aquaticus]MDP8566864.1 hypothetical protein [Methylophilus aquaticus]
MKTNFCLKAVLAASFATVSLSVWSGESPAPLPADEQGFVDAVGKLNRSQIIALLGEPARAEDVKLKDSGRIVASIWHYHNINKDAQGAFYPTTELDIIDDQVSVVVFLNNDGSDASSGQSYEVAPNPADI